MPSAVVHDEPSAERHPVLASQLVGHEAALAEFRDAFRSGRAHHAWLLQGSRGIGKTTAAFRMARDLLAGGHGSPEEADAVVRRIAGGAQPNLLHLKRQLSDRGVLKTQITVDEIRKLKHFFQTTSGTSAWRIAIVDPVDDLNRNAANALLKILEEPPERSLFLLVNHSPGRLLPTIRSRCRVLRFAELTSSEILKVLILLELTGSAKELEAAASRANGSAQEAIMLLEGGGLQLEERLDRVLSGSEPDWNEIQSLADAVSQRGNDTAFDLVLASLVRRLGEESERALRTRTDRLAAELAELAMEESARFREAVAYNLDRRQMLMTHFARRAALRRGSASH